MKQVMHAGRLRRKARIEKKTDVMQDGQRVDGWEAIATVPACVEGVSASEAWRGSALRSDTTDVVTIRFRRDVLAAGGTLRVVVDGCRALNVAGVTPDERNVWLTLSCKT